MPIYNFACEQCGKRFEELVAYDRRHEVTCPACNGAARVQVSACSVKAGSTTTGAAPAAKSPFT